MGTKNCPETPRQKMINMMYLVLLAMMALNVASEVLDAFRIVDSSLMQTFKSVDSKNEQIYASFAQAYEENPTKVDEWKKKADLVKSMTDSLINKITSLKEELVIKSGGTNLSEENETYNGNKRQSFVINNEGDTLVLKKDDELNIPSEIMIRLNKAEELKAGISDLKEEFLSLLEENSPMRYTIKQALDTSDPKVTLKDSEKITWEIAHFESKPLIAVIALLSKIQIDIQNAESNILTYLYSQIDASSFKFNRLRPTVIEKSSYILEGDVYRAEVFLAAEDTTQQPIILVKNKELKIEGGKGIYERPATSPGTYKWGGIIKYKTPEGEYKNYKFEEEYQVSKPSVTISPIKMNVFYMGVPNPVSVSVPGVPSEKLQVTMSNGKIDQDGKNYVVYPKVADINGNRTKVSVSADFEGKQRFIGSMDFRVKQVPDPVATVAGENSGVLRKEDLLAEAGIFADLKDFDFDLKFKVTQFDITFTGTGGYNNTWSSDSNRFTDEQRTQFNTLAPGSIIYIDNIFAHGDDGTDRELSPISFKIR
ncbi:gliding motility protein GldM [uncultured Sunxiuqinia sp.]|uniref:type IX secretion system motor protein PorM/GldM n=1 Tax=uncultured Sunxiuqinia sp. TaxID=1573825 RepID=UPI002AA94040|nr:gliding motility protein GldM [uncultured Sunxiuqinia sp.]